MRTVYSTAVIGICPVDGSVDVYKLTVESDRMIPVEAILDAVASATASPAYQEGITAAIRSSLGRGRVTVRTTGRHSGVQTTIEVH